MPAETITSVRAKVVCQGIKEQYSNSEVILTAVHSETGENADFTAATPYGYVQMGIYPADRPAATFFKPGKTYYLDFTEAPE
jgi:hypothetical protein